MVICEYIFIYFEMSKHHLVDNRTNYEPKKFRSNSLKADTIITEKISPTNSNVISIAGEKFIDTDGGFLLEEKSNHKQEEGPLLKDDESYCEFTCLECEKEYYTSFLQKSFDYPVCDGCKDKEKHPLITRTDAKIQYLLKDCDLDKREPLLKFILRKNPHNVNWGEMKLYLQLQIEKRAIEVWGSLEKLEEAFEMREEKREKTKIKKYNKHLKALRMEVRSSLFNRTSGPAHQHEFGSEKYNEDDDNYSRTCLSCKFTETYEKM